MWDQGRQPARLKKAYFTIVLFSFLSFSPCLQVSAAPLDPCHSLTAKSSICTTNVDVAFKIFAIQRDNKNLCPCARVCVTQPPTQLSESCLYFGLLISPLKVRTHHRVRWSLFIPARLPAPFSQTWLRNWLNVGHFSSLPNECLDSETLHVSLHVCVCDMREETHALTWISCIDYASALFSDLLAGEEVKSSDEIFLTSSHYLYARVCCTLSDGAQKLLDTDCGNRFYQTPNTQRRDRDREKERNRCQLSSNLYIEYLKFLGY